MGTPTFNDFEFQVRFLQEQNEVLTQRLQMATEQLERTVVSNPVVTPKISLPDKYAGDASGYRGFVSSLTLLFELHRHRYPDDLTKIYTVGSLLTGRALAWFAPLLESHSGGTKYFGTYADFMRSFGVSFGPVDVVVTSAYALDRLKQGRLSASAYATTFKQYAADLGWNDSALIHKFRAGLNDNVKDILVGKDYPETLDQAVEMAIRADQMLHQRVLERRSGFGNVGTNYGHQSSRFGTPAKPVVSTGTPDSGVVPMQLDMIEKRGPLTAEERSHRLANRLCIVCGVAGHYKVNCPVAKPRQETGTDQQGKDQGQ